ncbi:unnamed protein product [Rotaria sordida]|uniref:SAM-dependent methyltransferase RsmB-F/NOP2-type catalytic core domain-containing protein n=1 Tax=Rotaria sordida TaxID=392033 RepID=A0A813SW40_9BILA|nr:unnamed protein product [Rotaria sordida]
MERRKKTDEKTAKQIRNRQRKAKKKQEESVYPINLSQITPVNRHVNVDPLDKWSKVCFVIYNSQVPIDATTKYLCGHYMLQGTSRLCKLIYHMDGFDGCLVDASCSGIGVIAKDPAVKYSKNEKDIQRCFLQLNVNFY